MEPIAVEGGKGAVELQADGVIHLLWKPGATIEATDAQAAMDVVNNLNDGSRHPMVVQVVDINVSREARTIFSLPSRASRIALLGSSPVDRVFANFFLGVRPPPCPTRFFTSKDEAMDWLLRKGIP